jgi:putative flippase GtrA
MAIDIHGVKRFFKYSLVGSLTFAFDLGLLFLLADAFGWQPVYAAGCSFVIAISINYLLSRRYVFVGSIRSAHSGYGMFVLIAGTGLMLVMGFMALMTSVFGWNYLFARVVIAGITGLWNYLLNLYVNFKVAGKHSFEKKVIPLSASE